MELANHEGSEQVLMDKFVCIESQELQPHVSGVDVIVTGHVVEVAGKDPHNHMVEIGLDVLEAISVIHG